MKTLNWKRTDWFARNYVFTMEQQIVGELIFNSSWNFDALYADSETKLRFAQKSFWDKDVVITKHGKAIGEIHSGFFGEQTLFLATGEQFFLSTNLWEQEAYWKTEQGETIIKYQQAPLSSMAKGSISMKDSLANETEKLLISSGVYARLVARKRIARSVAAMAPILAALSQL